MPAKFYPFIDIAVHERVREHFTRGDAAVLFSPDMGSILWSNGAGAALFGFDSIYDFLDLGAERSDVAFRQLAAAARQLGRSGDRKTFVMRLASGFRSVPVNAAVEMITVRPGEVAILFAAPSAGKRAAPADAAARMISGLDDPDTHMAVLDADGTVLAASEGFENLSMAPETRRALVSAVGRDRDWLIKRPVATGKGHLPAAIGKLSDEPALHLLFAVETILGNLDPDEAVSSAEATVGDETLQAPLVEIENVLPLTISGDLPANEGDEPPLPAKMDIIPAEDAVAHLPEPDTDAADDEIDVSQSLEIEPVPVQIREETSIEADFSTVETSSEVPTTEDVAIDDHALTDSIPEEDAGDTTLPSLPEAVDLPLSADDQLENENTAQTISPEEQFETDFADLETVPEPNAAVAEIDVPMADGFQFEPQGRAIRFVWKIDADGYFSEISDEFASAVGPRSADVVGRSFADLAVLYGLDPDNTITDLLKRRDTWSGKTVFWPVEGEAALVVPVDLAALPTYSRNRIFDGFRGFGIVRVGDAVESPKTIDWNAGDDTASSQAETSEDVAISEDVPDVSASSPAEEMQGEDYLFSVSPEKPDQVEDPFRGELPALRITDNPGRRASDKIVDLDSHRRQSGEALTRNEQAAFREIARQLGEHFEINDDKAEDIEPTISDLDTFAESEGLIGTAIDTDEIADIDGGEPQLVHTGEDEVTLFTEEDPADTTEAPFAAPRTGDNAGLTPELVDVLPVALLIHSGDTLYHANPEFLSLTGYESVAALEEEGGIDALFAGDDEGFGDLPAGTMMLLRSDGRLLNVTARLQSIRWQDKSALMLALAQVSFAAEPTIADIPTETVSEETQSEIEALHLQIEELHSILETATDGVVVIGADNEIRSLNRSASALFNYDEEEIRGKPFASLFAHESQKAVIDYLSGLSGHGVASVLNDGREVIGREASGGFIPLFMTMGRLASSNGYCAVIRDITQWKRTEEELRSAKRAAETANAHKTESLARISHEIRTPLNAIIGFSDMMASEHFGPIGNPRYVEYAADIGRSGRHVLDIVNDLLDISKIEAGEMELEFSAVEINDAVSEAVSLVQPQANSQRVIIRTSLSTSVPNIVADSRSIKQMALNILANAIRFTPAGGQIVVSTAYETNGSVILRIRDTGIGMTRAELEQAMKPFRQVTTGTRKRGDGTGLGLPLTKAMAEANRAQFSISSTPNEGTLVEVTFPPQRVLAN